MSSLSTTTPFPSFAAFQRAVKAGTVVEPVALSPHHIDRLTVVGTRCIWVQKPMLYLTPTYLRKAVRWACPEGCWACRGRPFTLYYDQTFWVSTEDVWGLVTEGVGGLFVSQRVLRGATTLVQDLAEAAPVPRRGRRPT